MKTKVISLLLCIMLASCCLTGCGDSGLSEPLLAEKEEDKEEEKEPESEEKPEEEREPEAEEEAEEGEEPETEEESEEEEETGDGGTSEVIISEEALEKMKANREAALQESENRSGIDENFTFIEFCDSITRFELENGILIIESEDGRRISQPIASNCAWEKTGTAMDGLDIYGTWSYEELKECIDETRRIFLKNNREYDSPGKLVVDIVGGTIVRIYTIFS